MTDAVRAAHDDELPNDSRYELIRDCLQALSDDGVESLEEAHHGSLELADGLVPIGTGELLSWFAEMPGRLSSCEEAREEWELSDCPVENLLAAGYQLTVQNVIFSLADSLEDASESIFDPDSACVLLLSDSHGIYIPKLWADELSEEEAEEHGVSWQDVLDCQSGPDNELYWEAWQSILDSARWEEDGEEWNLHQNGDLWRVRADAELPEGF